MTARTRAGAVPRPPRYFSLLDERLRELLSIGDDATPESPDQEYSVSRLTLRQVLLTDIEDVVTFDRKFTHDEQRDDGTVTAFFDDGSSATGDLLVGADGTSSSERRQHLPHARLVETDLFGVTGKLPLTDETRCCSPAPEGAQGRLDGHRASRLQHDPARHGVRLGPPRARPHHHLAPPTCASCSDASTPRRASPLNIRTSQPVASWPTSTVTLIGDAIHTMTPGTDP